MPTSTSTALTSTLASTHSSTIFATFATAIAIIASAAALAFAFTMLATALAFSALAIPLPPLAPPASILTYLLACLWVPEPAPNVGAQPTGLEADRTASADGALLRLSNSPALTAALTSSAVTTVAASVEADLRGAGLDLR